MLLVSVCKPEVLKKTSCIKANFLFQIHYFMISALCYQYSIQMEFVESTRGNPKLCFNGFMYNKNATTKAGRIRWRCVRRQTHCKGFLSTSGDMQDPHLISQHNHDPCQEKVIIYLDKYFFICLNYNYLKLLFFLQFHFTSGFFHVVLI